MRVKIDTAQGALENAIARHERFALNFGGGKDSHACLYLLRPWWSKLIVLWGNMGDPFPETIELMNDVRTKVGEFHEVRGNAKAAQEIAFPVDLVPVRATRIGRMIEPDATKVELRSRYECCAENLWFPLARASQQLGITLTIRGQRSDEGLKAPIKSGDVAPQYEVCFPLEDWTAADVYAYLEHEGVQLPETYRYARTSLDCMLCTAFVEDTKGRYEYLKRFHPEHAKEYQRRLRLIAKEQQAAMGAMWNALCDIDAADAARVAA